MTSDERFSRSSNLTSRSPWSLKPSLRARLYYVRRKEYQLTLCTREPEGNAGAGNFSTDLNDYVFPKGVRYIYKFIYPYLNTFSSAKEASNDLAGFNATAEEFLPPNAVNGSARSSTDDFDTSSTHQSTPG
jgi:hypothetical protein